MTHKWLSPYPKRKMALDSATAYIPTIMDQQMWESSKLIQSTLQKAMRMIALKILRSQNKSTTDRDGVPGLYIKRVLIKNT